MNYEQYEGWQATLEVMSDPDWPKRLARAKRESKEGKWSLSKSFISVTRSARSSQGRLRGVMQFVFSSTR